MPSGSPAPPRAPTQICAVVLVERIEDRLVDALHALATQTRAVDALILLDATSAGDLPDHLGDGDLARALPVPVIRRIAAGRELRDALQVAVEQAPQADAVWVLTGQAVPAPETLARLDAMLASDRAAAFVGPKLLDSDRPGRLRSFGIQVTRAGALHLDPRPGTPDQQQFDDRTDALAVSLLGALVRREAYLDLGEQTRRFGPLGSDLDLGWRAHLAGHRVLLAPRARISVAPGAVPAPTNADRRDAHRVALARQPILLTPLLALWIAVSSLATALALLALKRPAAAAASAADLAALADPWRPIAARWRTRRQRRHESGATRGLFVTPRQTGARISDRLHDLVLPGRGGGASAIATPSATPGGPPLIANPAIWGTAVIAAITAVAARTLPSGLGELLSGGMQGGELRSVRGDSTGLWHAWWDGWAGPGLGSGAPASPGLPGLAVLTWLLEAVPGGAPANPAGAAVALAIAASLPLAFVAAFVASRVVTTRTWPRVVVAALWALSPVATAALAAGRLGALVMLVLLPLVLASLIAMTRPGARPGILALAAVLTAALATVVPGILIVGGALAVAMMAGGSPSARRRAAAYAAVLALAAIPTLLLLRAAPAALLGGWGLLSDAGALAPWQVALGQPEPVAADGAVLGSIRDHRTWLGAAVLVLGLAGLAFPVRRRALAAGAGALAVAGLLYAVAAPLLRLGADTGGIAVHPWPGMGLLLMTAGLLGAALIAAAPESVDPEHEAHSTIRRAIVLVGGAAALAMAGQLAYAGLGEGLSATRDPRPAVAIDAASGPAATRTLVLSAEGERTAYELIGRELGLPVRDVPVRAADRRLDGQVAALIDSSSSAPDTDPVRELAAWAVGFVVLDPAAGEPLERRLEASAGLIRIADHLGNAVFRVDPVAGSQRLTPARIRLAAGTGWGALVPADGDHAATRTTLPGSGSTLLIAQPPDWAQTARVSVDGTRLAPAAGPDGQLRYAVPAGAQDLRVALTPQHPYLDRAYLALLLFLAYLAVPIGMPARRHRSPDPWAGDHAS